MTEQTQSEPAEPADRVEPDERAEVSDVEFAGTGRPAVDAALQAAVAAAATPPADQVPAYQALHRTLRETLASIDQD